ncbi:MAG: AAA family ATPase, partial [Chloroflexi bacterium]|nr:AAA family ATPase [Chloroflexota bacterium]
MVEQNPQETPPRPRGAFVGRQREMGELASAFERSVAGHGRVVLLAGDPGIGKTRIANEFAEIAGWRGARIAWGRCHEGGGAPPYWPWVQVLRGLIRTVPHSDIASRLGAGAAYLAELLPEIREQSALPPLPGMDSPESARFRLFDSVVSMLAVASEKTPVLAMLDDIHWADESSLRLLEFVGQQVGGIRVLLVGTYRHTDLQPRHPLLRTLGGLNRGQGFVRLDLAGITQEDVASYIRLSAGIEPPETLSSSVHAQTEGNPLFVTEAVRLLLQEGELSEERISSQRDWSIRIPDGIRDVMGRRLERLSVQCRQALDAASIFGRRFEADEIAGVLRTAGGDSGPAIELASLLDVLDEAVAAYLVELVAPAGQYQFTHPLIREVLYTELPTGRRARLHSIVAEALETTRGLIMSLNRVMELANHYALAQPVGSREKLIKYTILAGERALASLAPDEAAQVFERCLELVRGKAGDLEIAQLSLGAGRAYAQSMKGAQAIDFVEAAFQIYLEQKEIDSAIAAAETRLDLLTTPLDRSARLVKEGLSLVKEGSRSEAILRIRSARIGSALGLDFKSAAASADRAVEIARQLRDRHLELDALVTSATVATWHGNWKGLLLRSEEVLSKVGSLDEPAVKSAAHFNVGSAHLELGRPGMARPHIRAAIEEAERARLRMELISAFPLPVLEAGLRGAWDEARAAHSRPLEMWPRDPRHLLARAWVEYQVGDFETGDRFLEPAFEPSISQPPGSTWPALLFWPSYARIAGRTDRLDQAAEFAREFLSHRHGQGLFPWLAEACLATVAMSSGDKGTVAGLYPTLSARIGCLIMMTTSMDRLLGNIAQFLQEYEKAERHYEDALGWSRKAGYVPDLGWTCHDYAEMLVHRSGGLDRAKVDKLLEEAEAIASRLGMRPLLARTGAVRETLAARRGGRPMYPSGLTEREVEVL